MSLFFVLVHRRVQNSKLKIGLLLSASIRNYGNVFKDVKFAYLLTQH